MSEIERHIPAISHFKTAGWPQLQWFQLMAAVATQRLWQSVLLQDADAAAPGSSGEKRPQFETLNDHTCYHWTWWFSIAMLVHQRVAQKPCENVQKQQAPDLRGVQVCECRQILVPRGVSKSWNPNSALVTKNHWFLQISWFQPISSQLGSYV